MKPFAGHVAALIVSVLLLDGGVARADFMNWSASWSLGPGQGPSFVSGLSNVALALSPAGAGGPSLNVGNFTTNSVTTEADTFHSTYDLSMHITDGTTHDTGTLTFHGLISGTTGPDGQGLTNNFSNPSQTLTLDGHSYKVSLEPSTVIPDTNHAAITLSALVSVADASSKGGGSQGQGGQQQGGGGVQQAPEPSSLLLVGTALCFAGAAWRWARTRKQFAASAA
jgi:hypothetical protein